MKQKTAMMVVIQAIDDLSQLCEMHGREEAYKALVQLKGFAEDLLKGENRQIMNAYKDGYSGIYEGNANKYFYETYLKEDEL